MTVVALCVLNIGLMETGAGFGLSRNHIGFVRSSIRRGTRAKARESEEH